MNRPRLSARVSMISSPLRMSSSQSETRRGLFSIAALAQGRQMELNRVQPKKQILAEFAGRNFCAEIRVGGGHETDAGVVRAGGADALVLSRFDGAKNLGLLAQRNVADFVEEQRAAIGQFEATGAIVFRIGECAPHMTEQFALEHAFGQSAQSF